MKAYKGFEKDMTCRGFQYEEGKEYETDKAELCESGFHACEYPLDCFGYYPPTGEFHEVELDEVSEKREDDTKICGKKIKIGARLTFLDMIKASFDYVYERCTSHEQGEDNTALNGGNRSALNGGNRSALNGGNRSALNGGNRSALNGGDWSALNGGDWSALNGGDRSALNGGDWSVIYGGEGSKVKGGMRSVIAIQYWKGDEFQRIVFAEIDGEKFKPDTWYTLNEDGEMVEAEKIDGEKEE